MSYYYDDFSGGAKRAKLSMTRKGLLENKGKTIGAYFKSKAGTVYYSEAKAAADARRDAKKRAETYRCRRRSYMNSEKRGAYDRYCAGKDEARKMFINEEKYDAALDKRRKASRKASRDSKKKKPRNLSANQVAAATVRAAAKAARQKALFAEYPYVRWESTSVAVPSIAEQRAAAKRATAKRNADMPAMIADKKAFVMKHITTYTTLRGATPEQAAIRKRELLRIKNDLPDDISKLNRLRMNMLIDVVMDAVQLQ